MTLFHFFSFRPVSIFPLFSTSQPLLFTFFLAHSNHSFPSSAQLQLYNISNKPYNTSQKSRKHITNLFIKFICESIHSAKRERSWRKGRFFKNWHLGHCGLCNSRHLLAFCETSSTLCICTKSGEQKRESGSERV